VYNADEITPSLEIITIFDGYQYVNFGLESSLMCL
jgi:hypothetical protein